MSVQPPSSFIPFVELEARSYSTTQIFPQMCIYIYTTQYYLWMLGYFSVFT